MIIETNWMIYGANGYTGELIAREAVRLGLSPTLAGRNRAGVESLATELGLCAHVFDLGDSTKVATEIQGYTLMLHCAGPFSVTAGPMMEACIAVGVHYLDITGEIEVLERCHAMDASARKAGVVLCSGVGFDVIPTDCIAATLKQAMPDATHLALGFDSRSGMSPGTAKTSIEGMASSGKIRHGGRIETVRVGHKVRRIDFGHGLKRAMTIPWGDVSTAFHTTGIPNIETYIPVSTGMILGARFSGLFRPFLRLRWVQDRLKARIERTVKGPEAASRAEVPTYVWGEVRNVRGEIRTARVRTDNVYNLTVTGALAVINYLLENKPEGGSYTPATLIDANLVTRLPGSGSISVD